MASCDVQATLSDENVDEDSAKAEPKTIAKNGTVPQPTRIPGPVRLNESGSYIHTSTRKYTSLMKSLPTKTDMNDNFSSTSTLVNVTEDSGVQLDCSVEGDNSRSELQSQASSLTTTPCQQRSSETIATSGSLDELEAAEKQTLRVLQRAVAEMEADVALHAEILEEQIKLELENQMNLHIEHEVQKEIEKTLLQKTVDQQKWQQQQEQLEQQDQLQSQSEGESIEELDLDLELELELDLKSDSTSQQSDFIDLSQPIDDDQTNPSSPSPSPRAGARERKHVRVEELLEAEHDIELLHKLLQVDNDQYTGEMAALAQPTEIHCLPDLNAGRDMLVNLDRFTADDEAEWHRKPVSIFHSLLQIICGNRIRKLSYPILFCGMAVGLIYYFRKN